MPKIIVHHHTDQWYRWFYLAKFPATAMFGIVVTLMLLYLMQYLIDSGQKELNETPTVRFVDFVRTKQVMEVQTKKRKPEPPPTPDEPPPQIQQNTAAVNVENAFTTQMQAPVPDINLSRSASFSADGEYLPILKVAPQYPRMALSKGWFGWVMLEFTVDENGKVTNPVVVDNCVETYRPGGTKECVDSPGMIFDRPAISAALKFKYKPKVVDGVPIETAGVLHKVTFTLNEMMDQQ